MTTSPEVSFGIMADCQNAKGVPDFIGKVRGTDETFRNCYRLSPEKLREAVKTFNQFDLRFIMHLGDFFDRDVKDVDELLDITNDSRAEVWHALGNHEFWVPGTNPKDIVELYQMPDKYYSKQVDGNRFVVLDTNELGPLEHPPRSLERRVGELVVDRYRWEGRMQAYEWNGGLSGEQMEWLHSELTDAESEGQKAFLFSHHPVFPPSVLNALNDVEIMRMIDSHTSVKAYINGHNHAGNYGHRKGIPYVTIEGMLSDETNAFAVADVYDDHMDIAGYGRVPSRRLDFAE
jgi:3',5'-cyclic AMP phosphodiesterase CpdA